MMEVSGIYLERPNQFIFTQLLRERMCIAEYRDRLNGMQILLSRTQAGAGKAGKQEQEQTSRKHVQAF